MTTSEINLSIKKMQVHLSQRDKWEHWLNFAFLVLFLMLIGYTPVKNALHGDYSPFFWIVVALIVLLFWHKWSSLRLEAHEVLITETQFKTINEAAARQLGWKVVSNTKHVFTAIKPTNWLWDGIRITVIRMDGKLYLSCMVNPSLRSNPFTFGSKQRIKATLLNRYLAVRAEDSIA